MIVPKIGTLQETPLTVSNPLQKLGPINFLPQELLLNILRNSLPALDLFSARGVSRIWKVISNLTEEDSLSVFEKEISSMKLDPIFLRYTDPKVKVFGEKAWEKYFDLEVRDVPPLPKNILEIMQSFRTCLGAQRKSFTCSLVLMPKGLNLNELNKRVIGPRTKGKAARFDIYDYLQIPRNLKEKCIEQSYWVLITDGLVELNGQFHYIYADQLALLKEKVSDSRPPRLMEAAVSIFMHHVSSGKCFFGNQPVVYTNCVETDLEGHHFYVGKFFPPNHLKTGRLHVSSKNIDPYYLLGMAACLEFL